MSSTDDQAKKKDLQYYKDRPEEYIVTQSNAVLRVGQRDIIAKFPGPFDITEASSLEMHRLRKEKALRSHLLGLARGAGIEIAEDADFETLLKGASDGLETLVSHTVQTYLKSGNLRGMGEVFGKLTAPMLGVLGGADAEDPRPHSQPAIILLLQALQERRESIEGQFIEPAQRGVRITKGD
jgi:hypothetical protein